ncbi:UbiA prenyltransferase [Cubamyces menziesii]|nr:UbiA prenyltransferase [Cubamyces menziesii]
MSDATSSLRQSKPAILRDSPAWGYLTLTRLHKFPAGSILVFWPGAWGVILSARAVGLPAREVAIQTLIYAIGSTLRHNAACIWNDICDREFDRRVERSKTRPLACGAVSLTGAVLLLVAHIAACYLLLTLAGFEGRVGLFGLFFLDVIYPLTKRWTYWPQAWLGLAMTWELPVSWISIQGYTYLETLTVLFCGSVCWTIYYDTIYACQDRRDDVKAGVKSTAVLFGDCVRPILSTFATLFLSSLIYVGYATSAGPWYLAITVAGTATCFVWQLSTVDFDDGGACWKTFKANGDLVGFVVWAGMMASYIQE